MTGVRAVNPLITRACRLKASNMALMDVFLSLVPSLAALAGIVVAVFMYLAPVDDMRRALRSGDLGKLNPTPFVYGLANSFGWMVYGYFQQNLILAASAMPGFLISLYLNMGAIKLQYHARQKARWEYDANCKLQAANNKFETWSTGTASTSEESMEAGSWASLPNNKEVEDEIPHANDMDSFVPQETALFRVVLGWVLLCVYAGYFVDRQTASLVVGSTVNLILLIFYGAPLQMMRSVVESRDSSCIHRPSMVMTFSNAFFWVLYGLLQKDPIVYLPNILGCLLAGAQMMFCLAYPANLADSSVGQEGEPLLLSKANSYTIPDDITVV
jgi:solute carrier family 50 protein (sugar transporter)